MVVSSGGTCRLIVLRKAFIVSSGRKGWSTEKPESMPLSKHSSTEMRVRVDHFASSDVARDAIGVQGKTKGEGEFVGS